MYHIFLTHSSFEGHIVCFQVLDYYDSKNMTDLVSIFCDWSDQIVRKNKCYVSWKEYEVSIQN